MEVNFLLSDDGDFLLAVEVQDERGHRQYERGIRISDTDREAVLAAAERENIYLDEDAGGIFVPGGPMD